MKSLQATSLLLALGFVGTTHAVTPPQLPADGAYVINALREDYAAPSEWINRGCLVNGIKAGALAVHDWGNPLFSGVGQCGLSSDAGVLVQDRHAVWDVNPITTLAGDVYYVIRSRVDGKCLIRSNNGYASRPSMYRWSGLGATDDTLCGWPDADALAKNGQAAWSLAEFRTESTNDHVLVMEMSAPTYAVKMSILDLDMAPRFVYTQALNRWVFRLTRVE